MKIFHVEDDADIREIARMSLEMVGGFHVDQYEHADAALAVAAEARPDVLLLDVMMPGMTGPQLLAELRKMDHMAHVPAIYMTARVQPQEIEAFKKTGAVGVILKPFDPVTLGQEITEMLQSKAA
ncbi:response regulator [Thalassorhabdomicrobium marinisediminis]|uniref:Response regulatory domain-containing protein n=1 Tax=Thalassorhabdomicrobium marinisediminis TaxID=2170577 RepID=A0A2T7FZJ6_9RHOB|nr:response regulator [Thalassorhabdomicrobium marinisediminis]PVA07594.1 hypothetical protein DC363_02870 [Thalassorhabdomicrobium marinisediminis]